jgi:hypothetical protein
MPKYHIQNIQELNSGSKSIYYQGDNCWTTEHEHRKLYDRKKDATAELYDFGGKVIKDVTFDPNAIDGDGDGIVQEGTEFERPIE